MADKLQEIARLASLILIEVAPGSAGNAYVSRQLLTQLEAALRTAGYDIPAWRKRYRAELKAQAKKRQLDRDVAAVAKLPPGTRVKIPLYGYTKGSIPRLSIGTVSSSNRKLKADEVYVIWDDHPAAPISAHSLEPLS
jgi:hypothetical protein